MRATIFWYAKEGATVYLGLKDNIKPEEMLDELENRKGLVNLKWRSM